MSPLYLHKDKGVNPFLTYCPRCKGEGRDLILVGSRDSITHCTSCDMNLIGGGKCPNCKTYGEFVRKLRDGEKLPGSLCEACEKEVAEHKAIVANGGVYWKCKDCPQSGVLRGRSGLAIAVREKAKIAAPKPCGVEFTKDDCPVCGPNPAPDAPKKEEP